MADVVREWYEFPITQTKFAHVTNYGNRRNVKDIDTIVFHYTANNGDSALNNLEYFAREADLGASAHIFVDENDIAQSVSLDRVAYGAVGHNERSIHIEMCSKKENGLFYIPYSTQRRAAEVASIIMLRYPWIKGVCRHYDCTGKICPEPFVRDENLWQTFGLLLQQQIRTNRVRYSVDYVSRFVTLEKDKWIDKEDIDIGFLFERWAESLQEGF